ncbi:dTDP-L-rhamnose 4-epimerase [compost metagenome]
MIKGEGSVVALLARKARSGETFHIHGDGEQTRDFIYVKDVVRANLAAAQYKGQELTCNIGTSRRTSVNQLVAYVSKLHGTELNITHTPSRSGDIRHSCLDVQRADQQLRWTSRTDIMDGLQATIASL